MFYFHFRILLLYFLRCVYLMDWLLVNHPIIWLAEVYDRNKNKL